MSLHCQLPIANFRLILAPVTLTPIPFPVRQPKRQSAIGIWQSKMFYASTALVISASPTPSSVGPPLTADLRLISSTSRQCDCSSRTNTLNDSGRPDQSPPLLNDRFVDLRPSRNVVRLRSQQLLQNMCSTVGLKRPNFHFSKALSTKLRLTAERLLGDRLYGPIERA